MQRHPNTVRAAPIRDDMWFRAKSHGYGADLPIAWQGWALIAALIAVLVAAAALLLPDQVAAFMAVTAIATSAFLIVAARKTRGGWRWRWGEEA